MSRSEVSWHSQQTSLGSLVERPRGSALGGPAAVRQPSFQYSSTCRSTHGTLSPQMSASVYGAASAELASHSSRIPRPLLRSRRNLSVATARNYCHEGIQRFTVINQVRSPRGCVPARPSPNVGRPSRLHLSIRPHAP